MVDDQDLMHQLVKAADPKAYEKMMKKKSGKVKFKLSDDDKKELMGTVKKVVKKIPKKKLDEMPMAKTDAQKQAEVAASLGVPVKLMKSAKPIKLKVVKLTATAEPNKKASVIEETKKELAAKVNPTAKTAPSGSLAALKLEAQALGIPAFNRMNAKMLVAVIAAYKSNDTATYNNIIEMAKKGVRLK